MKKDIKTNKRNVAVIFGGKSVEHDISIITGIQVLNSLDKNRYNIFPIYINKEGFWLCSQDFFDIRAFKNLSEKGKNIFDVSFAKFDNNLWFLKGNKLKKSVKIDFAFLALHGGMGENGCIQGLLDCCKVVYSSCDHLGSGVCMNKLLTKSILNNLGIKYANFVSFDESERINGSKYFLEKVKKLNFPLIVKPCNLGSSIGITFCKNASQLKNAISFAFLFDKTVLVEEVVENLREVNISILGNSLRQEISSIEEVFGSDNFLSFENKYLKGSSKGMENTSRIISAEIGDELKAKIEESAKRLYSYLGLKGIVRIDYLIDKNNGEFFLNEVNTIPGSMANYLWKEKGYSFAQLLDKMMDFAFEENSINSQKILKFNSSVLDNYSVGNKNLIK